MTRQRGAALLAAMLTVALVATFAAAALWQQWRAVEIERAERMRVQSTWILTGALDWARLILREDARSPGTTGSVDHLGEPWSVPLQEARLSTFLAADKNNTVDSQADDTFLSGAIIDAQSLLNVTTLAKRGTLNEPARLAFGRLFEMLGLPASELDRLAENLRFASDIHTDNRNSAQAPLEPRKLEQLVWLGLSLRTVAVLEPYVTIIPAVETPVNLNTAPPEVIYAAVPGISLADAQRLVAERDRNPFNSKQDAGKLLGNPDAMNEAAVNVNSRYFEVRGRLRIGDAVVEERSLVERNGPDVKTLWRERGVVDPTALARAASTQR